MTYNNPKEAIKDLFEELYDSKSDIWYDKIHDALLYLADEHKAFDIVEDMNESIMPSDLCVIHKNRAIEIAYDHADKIKFDIEVDISNYSKELK